MSQRVNLPPGCGGFTCADGTRYNAKPGTSVVLEDRHAKALSQSQHQSIGLVKAGESFSIGTKAGRWCSGCARLWQAWSLNCPKCGAETIPERAEVTAGDAGDAEAQVTSPEPDVLSASTRNSSSSWT